MVSATRWALASRRGVRRAGRPSVDRLDEQRATAGPGDAIIVPAEVPFEFANNDGDSALRLLHKFGSPGVDAGCSPRFESIYRDLEQGWVDVIGDNEVERVRTNLEAVLLDPATQRLPPIRPPW